MLRSLKTLLLAAVSCALPFTAVQAFDISINFAPPPIPIYEQPLCPEEGYLWTPGYWGYEDEGYYWVPGVWVEPPRIGFLWTPGYWGFADGFYAFHSGYWGPRVGFYGGVNYGCGYYGNGYGGGRWAGDRFLYNTAVTRVNTTVIRNVYVNRDVLRDRRTDSRASFNGRGGIEARPTTEQRQAAEGPHLRATETQLAHRQEAARDRGQLASVNGGRPARLATERPGRGGGDEGRAERQAARATNREEGGFQRQGRGDEGREVNGQRPERAERPERTGREAGRPDGLSPDERQLARSREDRTGRDFAREQRREGGGNFGQDDAGRAERRAMRERQAHQQQQAQQSGMERRAEARQMQREAVFRQPRAESGERREPRAQGQGRGEGRGQERGEEHKRQHKEGDGQEH